MKINPQKLGLAMAKSGHSFKGLAEAANVSRATVSYINSGKTCRPNIAWRLAKALGVDPVELIETEVK